jgi:hypothetical protein
MLYIGGLLILLYEKFATNSIPLLPYDNDSMTIIHKEVKSTQPYTYTKYIMTAVKFYQVMARIQI